MIERMDALMLPLNWQKVRLGDIAEIIGGGTPSTQITSFWNGSINWFTPTEIGITKYVYKSQQTITPLGLKNSSAKLLPIGTILLTSRTSIGDCAILKVVATTNQGFQSLIPLEKINNEFLYYLILTLKNKLLKLASGSTFLEVSPNKIKNLLIPLPPLNEQSAIANILSTLDRYLCVLDALILKKEGVKKALSFELLSQRKRLKGFNQAWQRVRLGDICEITTGSLDANEMVHCGKYRFYTCAKEYYFIDKYAFDTEAILISGNGAYVGYVHYYKGKFNAYQRTYVLDNFSEHIIICKIFFNNVFAIPYSNK
ncbi:restriction endonuclease subunit S [Helicobacter pylori]